jgi:outer membrane protein OmpA-like peptidoglycan-associated protein
MTKRFIFIIPLLFLYQSVSAQLEAARYSIKNLKVNTAYSDLSTSLWGKGRVIFASSKNSKAIVKDRVKSNESKKAFLETFAGYIDKDYEIRFSKKVVMDFDSEFNQSNVSFTPDLRTVYFTQNSTSRGKNRTINLKLYKADVSSTGNWTNIKELPFNSNTYNCAHPSLSDDGSKLYFSSNMPGGYGNSDIYVVDILEGDKYGKPKNLGAYINSPNRDNFPEINNGLLYFSSDRPGGLGGLDIYMVPLGNLFQDPTNLGVPINSKADDFSFVINGSFRRGYFTSNRPQGKGGDDIYSFVQETAIKSCSQLVEGEVRDADTDEIVQDAIVNIFDEKGNWLNRFSTEGDGKFKIKLNKCEKNYKLEATKKHYNKDFADIIYEPNKELHKVTMHLIHDAIVAEAPKPKEPLEMKNPEEEMYLDVKNIDFILNKYNIRKTSAEELNKVVKIMKENPTLVVEFGAHTDSRGPDEYNMELSIKRANEVVRYIVSKGIDYNRIYGKGYGETMPVNHCVNGVKCTDAEHLENRRTEFLILAR